MDPQPPGGSTALRLSERLTLVAAPGQTFSAHIEQPVLGGVPALEATTLGGALFDEYSPVEQPIVLELPPPVPLGTPPVLGVPPAETAAAPTTPAELSFEADPAEAGAYLLVQEIQTPEGVIYDITLPQMEPAAEARPPVLGGAPVQLLRFPVNRVLSGAPPGTPDTAGDEAPVLGGLPVVDFAFRRVLNLMRAPVAPALREFIAERETQPELYFVGRDGQLIGPISSFPVWRARFIPAKRYRVLLFVHGFLSNSDASLPRGWVSEFGSHYDAVLAYNHPTISRNPLENALELLEMLPDDIQLEVDVVAHSRGGLVARSIVELIDRRPQLQVRRLLTCGSPHAGTPLAHHQRWDRLISIGMTAASGVLAITGVAASLAFVPQLAGYLLRAGGQFFFDLPGPQTMMPGNPFLNELNNPPPDGRAGQTPYALVTSAFDPATIERSTFRQALKSMAVQVFIDAPNDLVVPTDSMSMVDRPTPHPPGELVLPASCDHFTYFEPDQQEILTFAGRFLAGA